jgi:hypothetical protein
MDSPVCKHIDFRKYYRRYGVEIEVNAMDGRARPPGENQPEGIHYVGLMVNKVLDCPVQINKWHHTHHNNAWVVKPDSSCGMEICSPVSKGTHGLNDIMRVIEAVRDDINVEVDERCSLHLHVEVADLSVDELAAVLAYWIKCEYCFLNSVPPRRKRNRYCQQLGITDLFEHNSNFTPNQLINKLSNYKYFSLNTYHYNKGRRPTIEFRIMEEGACSDPVLTANWIRLIIHFVEMAKEWPLPGKYEECNPWSSYLWLDPKDVFKVLGFLPSQSTLSPDMEETRTWFLRRLLDNTMNTGLPGIWEDEPLSLPYQEIRSLADELRIIEG